MCCRIAGNGLAARPAFPRSRRSAGRPRSDHAELRGLAAVTRRAADGQVGLVLLVILDQVEVVHLVDVIAGQDHDVLGPLLLQRVDVLIDGVGRALIPMLVDPLLRRHHVDEFAQLAAQITPPAEIDVPVQAHRLVLRQHQHLADAAVEAVREREIDDPIERRRTALPAWRDRGSAAPVASLCRLPAPLPRHCSCRRSEALLRSLLAGLSSLCTSSGPVMICPRQPPRVGRPHLIGLARGV